MVVAGGTTAAGTPAAGGIAAFDLDGAWSVHPQVAVRPERFGALLYHFGTRRLSFLKDRVLLDVVQSLGAQATARQACVAAGVSVDALPRYVAALAALAGTDMLVHRPAPQEHT